MDIYGVQVNILAIVVAVFANIGVGMFWYSDFAFGKFWRSLVKKTEFKMDNMDMLWSTVGALLLAIGLNSILQFSHKVSGLMGFSNVLATSAMLALTINVPAQLDHVIWEKRNPKLFMLNLAHHFVTYVIMCSVIAFFV